MGDLALNHIIPVALNYQMKLSENVERLKSIGIKASSYATQVEMIEDISAHVTAIKKNVDEMIEARKKANVITNARDKAIAYCDKVKPYFDEIRAHVDKLEIMVDDELWPLPKYRELVTIR
jgi:glutamine synthetase